MANLCDHRSVGVIIEGVDGYAGPPGTYLMFERVKPPYGIAPVAGHVDEHGGYVRAMLAEAREEVFLDIVDYTLVTRGRRFNACGRLAYTWPRPGHDWAVYRAHARGIPNAAPAETKNLRWVTREEVQRLAAWTAMYALDRVTDEEFQADPGIEPVWVEWLVAAGIVKMSHLDLEGIDALCHTVRL